MGEARFNRGQYSRLGPNGRETMRITYKSLDEKLKRTADGFLEEIHKTTGLSLRIHYSYQIDFNFQELMALDKEDSTFNYELWERMMDRGE